jgi:DNA-binding MarR family transcriptional regulator
MYQGPIQFGERAHRLAALYSSVYRHCAPRYTVDLGHQSVRALQVLDDGPSTVAALAKNLKCAHNTASELVSRLARRSLVQKLRGVDDERVVKVSLTDNGRSCLEEHTLPDRNRLARALELLSDQDYRSIVDAFELLSSTLKALPQ